MDFFSAQDRARRNTALLVFYFLLAMATIIGSIYAVVAFASYDAKTNPTLWNPELLLMVAPAVLLLIGGGSLYKMAQLAGDGATVAETLGGRTVSRDTQDALERRLLNVVDEMAIASGVPVPQVFVLDQEHGINAFAAGSSPNEAAVAVTRGTLERLDRDELQGVIAHEFSHIFNGDMRLNIRLIGVLHGILLLSLIGRAILYGAGRSRGRNAGGVLVLGIALLIVGFLGVFFGRLIKAAVSRQREYLADAAAVQFTRNPDGIGGALRKIAGVEDSLVQHPNAEEASHLFFGQGLNFFLGLLATHPPIDERIRRIDPRLAPAATGSAGTVGAGGTGMGFAGANTLAVDPGQIANSIGTLDAAHLEYARELLAELPESVTDDLHRAENAKAVVYMLLLSDEPSIREKQEKVLAREGEALARAEAHRPWLTQAGPRVRLPLLDLALPSLAELPKSERQPFLSTVSALIRADERVSLFEYVVDAALRRRLLPRENAVKRSRDPRIIRADCELLLGALAKAGADDEAEARAAFAAAVEQAPLDGPFSPPEGGLKLGLLHDVLGRLVQSPPRFKRKLIEACAAAVTYNGRVTVTEGELLRAVVERLDAPMPPLLPGIPLS
ncbi:M48 family metallopeptidase [Thiohalomonas denitrificans]|uniref:Zn-dependent protease with chaperone function n=1 Tax=Thiohalomonas denitrificans TaxID=415747 RepID=A0A1G5QZ19_9GAMM|nr:M48 family metallopeptidase [Thiohalomonas denitrificans]SCZ66966.1 Zn-dependent protease with chaperone function [Thiohalomonas denitrificans]